MMILKWYVKIKNKNLIGKKEGNGLGKKLFWEKKAKKSLILKIIIEVVIFIK